MASLGMYHYEQHRHNLRTHLVVGLFFGMFLILALDYSPEKTAAALSLVYILIAMGVVTLLAQWYRIFPKNPFARTIGLFITVLFVVTNVAYHNQRYFSAWARAPETKVEFSDDVVIIDDALGSLIEEGSTKTLEIFAANEQSIRIEGWLSSTMKDQIIILDDRTVQTEALTPDILLLGPQVKLSDTLINQSLFELELELDTTSQTDPEIYRVYILK